MKVKHMTIAQCKRIIDAGFVGEHNKRGRQVDYVDYKEEILAHYWSLNDRKASVYRGARASIQVNPVSFDLESVELVIAVNRAFRPWKDISNKIQMEIM